MAVTRASNDATPQKKRKRAVDEEEQGGKRKGKFAEKKTPPSAKPKAKKSAAKRPKSESGYSVKKNEVVALLKRWKSMKPLTFKEDIKYAFYKGDPLYGRININCRISYVRDIENKLTGSDWRRILASPFGNVMKMLRQVTFSSQTVHTVLFKQLKSKKKWETWYEIGGKVSRFSMKEFALITGLNCGQMPPESVGKKKKKDVQVMEKFFGGPAGPKTSVQDLYERFRDYRVLDNYKLKMALLLIVEGIFLGGDKKRLVKAEHVKLLDNMDKFWDYPWGRVAYKEFHRSLTKSLARRMLTVEKALLLSEDARIPYTIQGMPVVFQVWIWECVKSFGVQYASKINETAIPRGLRWYSEQCPEHGLLQLCFADPKLKVLPILIADESEKSLLSACRFHDEVKDPFFDKIVSEAMAMGKTNAKLKEPNKGKEAFKGEVSGDANARQMMDIINQLCNKFDKMEHGLCERIDRLERKNVQVFEKVPKRKKRMVKKSEAQASDSDSEEFDGVDEYLDDSEGSETELASDSEGSDNEKSEDEDEDDEEDEKAGSDKAFSEDEDDEKAVSEDEKAGSDKAISEEEGEDEKAGTDKAVSGDHNLMDVDTKGNETEEGYSESIIEKEQEFVSEAFEQNSKDNDVNLDNSGLPIQVHEEVCGGNDDGGDDGGEKNHKLMDDDTKGNETEGGNSEPIIENIQEFVSEAFEKISKDNDVNLDDNPRDSDENVAIQDNSGLAIQVHKGLEENQEIVGVGRRTGDIVMDVVADISEKLNDKDGVPDDDVDSDRTITDDVEDAPREEKESQEAEVQVSRTVAVHMLRRRLERRRSGKKEEVKKEEVGKEGDEKEEAGKEEVGKEEVGKVLGEKEEAGKEEVGKEGDDKEEAGKEEVEKEGIEEFSKGQVVFGNRKKAVGTSPKKSRYLPKRAVKPSASVLSPYRSKKQNNQKAKDNEKDKDKKKEVRGKSFWKRITKNPAVKEMTPLIEWYKDERPIEFRGVSNNYIDNDFMESLIEPTKWWGNLHLDEVLILLRDALLKNPRESHKAAIMDCSWCEDYKDQHKCEMGGVAVPEFPDRVARYFRGELPIFHGKNWEEVDFIYAPLFVGTNHWVAIQIDLLNWSLSVFDCNANLKRDHVIEEAVAPIIKYLPKFVSKHEPLSKKYAHRGVSVLTYNGRVGNLEQNFRAGDCGVYTLKYIEWLSFGSDDLSLISDDTIDYHRFDIANSVFDKQWKTMLNYGQ